MLTFGYNADIFAKKGRSTSSERIIDHAHSLVARLHADRGVRNQDLFSRKQDVEN
jgi:hypothetical protein